MTKISRIILIILIFMPVLPLSGFTEDKTDMDRAFKRIALKLSMVNDKLPNKTIAIYGFEIVGKSNDGFGRYAVEKLTHELVSNGSFVVIERSRIDQVLKEQSLSMSGAIDASTAAHIGKILAVDGVIIGTIRLTGTDTEIIARLIQSEKGIILASVDERVHSSEALNTDDSQDKYLPDRSNESTADFRLTLDGTVYTRFQNIALRYSGLPGNQNDWITLVEDTTPDNVYGEWFYTHGQKTGSYQFRGVGPGNYEIRVYFDWPNGGYTVQKRIKIRVK